MDINEDKPKKGFFSKVLGVFSSSKESAELKNKPQASKSKRSALEARFRKRNRKFRQTVDTNIVSIGFNILEEDAQLAAGDAIFCMNCKSVFNKYSRLCDPSDEKALKAHMKEDAKEEEDNMGNKLEQINEDPEVVDEGEQIWLCEFCYTKNIVIVEKEEIPTEESVNYVLEVNEEQKAKSQSDVSVIFCLDISGSMWVTTPVEGKVKKSKEINSKNSRN